MTESGKKSNFSLCVFQSISIFYCSQRNKNTSKIGLIISKAQNGNRAKKESRCWSQSVTPDHWECYSIKSSFEAIKIDYDLLLKPGEQKTDLKYLQFDIPFNRVQIWEWFDKNWGLTFLLSLRVLVWTSIVSIVALFLFLASHIVL